MSAGASEVTLQVNVCAGDLAYAEPILEHLTVTHRADVREVVAVADCCAPQSTPTVHGPSRFPAAPFAEKVARLRELCARWIARGLVDRVDYLEPEDRNRFRRINGKYAGRASDWTHDHLGHAYTAYFAGWDCARTRYVAHFDADVLLHQAPGYSWLREAVAQLQSDARLLAASPRIAPPMLAGEAMVDMAVPGIAWMPAWRLAREAAGWRSDWFSTRCHVIDRQRLEQILPLVPRRGRVLNAWGDWLNRALFPLYAAYPWISDGPKAGWRWLADRLGRRAVRALVPDFPLPPEVLLYERAGQSGLECFYLGDPRAWYIHPDRKPAEFVAALPALLRGAREGRYPAAQAGFTGINLADWQGFA